MNILYLSHLNGASYAGPTYSVPAQIAAQSKIDNVFWYNATKTGCKEWKNLPYYHDLTEFPKESIYELPEPFNNPDLIVVELFYNMTLSNFRKELVSGKIPYIIIPRGELTKQAQERKKLKKYLANLLLCRKYARKALAIQYLTDQEYRESGDDWNHNHIEIPNGINIPKRIKTEFCKDGIKCVSIGRIEPYQKGLDLLIDACAKKKKELLEAKCIFAICGPDLEGSLVSLKERVQQLGLDNIICFHDGVYGAEKENLLMSADVFMMTSSFEGHPMALIEALSYGLPCIATTGSNMRKKIEDKKAGWGADNSIDSIAMAIMDMLSSKDLFKQTGLMARELSERYSWDVIAKESHELYVGMLNGKRCTK